MTIPQTMSVKCCRARSGLLPSLIGVCHVAVQFPLYEACKAKLAERAGTTVDNLDPLSVVSAHPCVFGRHIILFLLQVVCHLGLICGQHQPCACAALLC